MSRWRSFLSLFLVCVGGSAVNFHDAVFLSCSRWSWCDDDNDDVVVVGVKDDALCDLDMINKVGILLTESFMTLVFVLTTISVPSFAAAMILGGCSIVDWCGLLQLW